MHSKLIAIVFSMASLPAANHMGLKAFCKRVVTLLIVTSLIITSTLTIPPNSAMADTFLTNCEKTARTTCDTKDDSNNKPGDAMSNAMRKTIDDAKKNSQNDKLASLTDVGMVGVGTALGFAGSGTIATAAGATSIPVLTTVGSWVGITIVGATPIGWTIGATVAGGAVAYGVSKLIQNVSHTAGKQDQALNDLETMVSASSGKLQSSPSGNPTNSSNDSHNDNHKDRHDVTTHNCYPLAVCDFK